MLLLFICLIYDRVNDTEMLYYPVSDNEYFEVESLKELPVESDNYDSVSEQIKYFSGMIINSSFNNRGNIPSALNQYISDSAFKKINMANENEFLKDGTAYEYFNFTVYEVKHDFNKAIVDFGIDYRICYYGSNERISGSSTDEAYPYKLYLIHKDSIWVVDDVFIPA